MVTKTGPAPGSDMMTSAGAGGNRTASGVLYVASRFSPALRCCGTHKSIGVRRVECRLCRLEVMAAICTPDGSVAQAHAYASMEVRHGFSYWRIIMLPA